MAVTTISGTGTASLGDYTIPEVVAPTINTITGSGTSSWSATVSIIKSSNSLYSLLNTDLTSSGDSTWWNLWGTDTNYVISTYSDTDYTSKEFS